MSSRSDALSKGLDNTEEEIHDNGISKILPYRSATKDRKIAIIDGDSICWLAAYTGKDELGNKKPEYTEKEYEIAEGVATEMFLRMLNKIEEYFFLDAVYLCLKGKNNPRRKWYPDYKAKRPEALPIIQHLHDFLVRTQNGLEAPIGETDDLVAELVSKCPENAIVCGFDKDLQQLKGGIIHYNYKLDSWKFVSDKESKYLFHKQWITGDPSDGVNLSPKVGEKYAESVLNKDFDDFQYLNAVLGAYMKAWKGNSELAESNMRLAWKLLKLHTIEELNYLENEENR